MGAWLKRKVFCVGQLKDQGAGHAHFGLYTAKQVQRGDQPSVGELPEHGVVEVKSAQDDAWLTAESAQVSRYWGRYRLVLVTNYRDFVLVGEDVDGNPARLERFRLAADAEKAESRLSCCMATSDSTVSRCMSGTQFNETRADKTTSR